MRTNRDNIIASVATLLIALLLTLMMVWTYIALPSLDSTPVPPKEESDLILEADEYTVPVPLEENKMTGGREVMNGDDPSASSDAESAPALDDRVATAKEDVRTKPTEQPSKGNVPLNSSAKQDKKSKEEEAKARAKEAAEKEKAQRDARAAEIRNSVKFNGNGSADGQQGSPNGNSSQGASAGSAGHNLAGRTVESWGRPTSTHSGSLRIRVRVNAQGRVTSATYIGGTGSAAADQAVRRSCEKASLNSRFSVSTDNSSEQTGIITWNFK